MAVRRYSPLAAALVMASSFAPPAQAQLATYNNRCTTSGLIACFSLSIATTPLGSGTGVVISVTNWQGTGGYPAAAPSFLGQITFWNFASSGSTTYVSTATASGTAVGTGSAGGWVVQQDANAPGLLRLGGTGPQSPLAGCAAPSPTFPQPNYWSTCGGGALVLSFTIPTQWTVAADVPVTLSIFGDGSSANRCHLGTNNPNTLNCGEVTPVSVPEPEGWLLMASGILGLAFVGRRRRDEEA